MKFFRHNSPDIQKQTENLIYILIKLQSVLRAQIYKI